MKSLDYFYEEILSPNLSGFWEDVIEPLCEVFLLTVYCLTTPLWIVPYLIYRKMKGGK